MAVNAIVASQPEGPVLRRQQRKADTAAGASTCAHSVRRSTPSRQRGEIERISKRLDNGYLERAEIVAEQLAAGNSGFGGTEAVNDGDFSSAA
ncbi:MAG: hypothetical protein OET44_19345 [Gammaproteobacteria bacterium]|nr:hypothetical protein [Gammaproteobacteria bacterium]